MKYFRIRHSHTDTGQKFPQVETAIGDFNVTDTAYIGNVSFYLKPINCVPVLPELVLYKSAKVTDLISSSFSGTGSALIVSHKLKSILEKYWTNGGQQAFEIKIHHNNSVYHYWLIHPSKNSNELIDFSKSEVWELQSLKKNRQLQFNDWASFHEEAKATKYPQTLQIEKVSLSEIDKPHFFLLSFIPGGVGFFVSEQIKKEIETTGCTGIVFSELNERYP
jgi:hypothetical protein